MATIPEQFHNLFRGSDQIHGRTELVGVANQAGKREAKSWTERGPATPESWAAHLAGTCAIGVVPICAGNLVHWGAIDVDQYSGIEMSELAKGLAEAIPQTMLCRSKSGGPHIYLFISEPVPARSMIAILSKIAAMIGRGGSEIFPKQASLGNDGKTPEFGNWINMPYFNGAMGMRFGYTHSGEPILDSGAFIEECLRRRMSKEQMAEWQPPKQTTQLNDTLGPLLDGAPPCLQQIMARRVPDMRNITLSNLAVFCKRAHGNEWAVVLDQLNSQMSTPLGSNEVEAIKRSYGKKEYRYQCSKSPLQNYCDPIACKACKHGITTGEATPAMRSLTMICTDPPTWYLDIDKTDGSTARVSLGTPDLQSHRLFQLRCMEQLQSMPTLLQNEEWHPLVQELMRHCNRVEVSSDVTPTGQYIELVHEFLRSCDGTDQDETQLLRGMPYRDASGYHFRMRDLKSFLKAQRFTELNDRQTTMVLIDQLHAITKRMKTINGVGVRFITIPTSHEPAVQEISVPATLRSTSGM